MHSPGHNPQIPRHASNRCLKFSIFIIAVCSHQITINPGYFHFYLSKRRRCRPVYNGTTIIRLKTDYGIFCPAELLQKDP